MAGDEVASSALENRGHQGPDAGNAGSVERYPPWRRRKGRLPKGALAHQSGPDSPYVLDRRRLGAGQSRSEATDGWLRVPRARTKRPSSRSATWPGRALSS